MTIGSSIRAAATWALVRVRRIPWLHKPVHAIAVLIVRTPLGARWVKAVLEPEYPTVSSYEGWVAAYDTLSADDRKAIAAHIASMNRRPLISVVMPTYDTPEPLLTAAIESIRAQLYTDWELCIADDASPSPHVWKVLSRYAAKDPRIKVTRRKVNGHICAATNSALALASGEFVALMDHDDLLPERALYEVAAVLDSHPDADLIYSDEDKVDGEGRRFEPHFKTDWNPELLLGQNMISHLGVYRRSLVETAGGLREGFEGSQDYDLALRISELTTPARIHHIPWILYHWRQQSQKESFSEANMNRCADAAFRAVSEHLARTGQTDAVVAGQPRAPGWLHVRRRPPVPNPLVSVIVPTRDRSELLARCLDGVLRGTDYKNLEVIVVDNGSVEPETRALFATLSEDRRVRVAPAPGPFNYSALNNQAAELARGEILLLLNNDISVIEPDWLGEMVAHAMRPNIGAVGARLLFPDGRLQHGGVILGIGAGTPVAGHAGYLAHRDDGGYYGHLMTPRNVSAVTGACLAMRKAIFHEVGGLDAEHLKVAFNDVDLCLKIRARGYDIVWTPFAELYHHESASRGLDLKGEALERFQREIVTMRERWGEVLDNDPFYGPAFSKRHGDYRLADPPPRTPPWKRQEP